MKKGKIILSAAAMIVSAAGIFAFKSHSNANQRHHLFGSYKTSGNGTVCAQVSCWTKASGTGSAVACHTATSGLQTVRKTYTQKTTVNNKLCKNLWTGLKTHTN
jgi:hypothetical protein